MGQALFPWRDAGNGLGAAPVGLASRILRGGVEVNLSSLGLCSSGSNFCQDDGHIVWSSVFVRSSHQLFGFRF